MTVTEKAAVRLKQILARNQPNNPEAGIRISVRAGGCSGFIYSPLSSESKPSKYDKVFESKGVRIFVDPKTLVIVKGTEIDHGDNLLESFIFNNPNAKNSCGCGTSFELK